MNILGTRETKVSETIIEETGVFKRTLWRKGKQKRQRTERKKKNPAKVVLAKIGDLDLYVYPYDFPDKVFLGSYPNFTMSLDKADVKKLFKIYNISKWYLDQEGFTKPKGDRKSRRGADARRRSIQKAYSYGLNKIKELQKRRKKEK